MGKEDEQKPTLNPLTVSTVTTHTESPIHVTPVITAPTTVATPSAIATSSATTSSENLLLRHPNSRKSTFGILPSDVIRDEEQAGVEQIEMKNINVKYSSAEETTINKRVISPSIRLNWSPILSLFFGFCSAVFYVLLPNLNFWFYNLVRNQWWAIVTTFSYIELQELAIPDTADVYYVASHYIGFISPVIMYACAYASGDLDNIFVSIFAVTISVIAVLILYLIDVIHHPRIESKNINDGYRGSGVIECQLFDCFESSKQCRDIDKDEEEVDKMTAAIVFSNPSLLSNSDSIVDRKDDDSSSVSAPLTFSPSKKNWLNTIADDRKRDAQSIDRNSSFCGSYVDDENKTSSSVWLHISCYYLPRYIYQRNFLSRGIVFGDRRHQW